MVMGAKIYMQCAKVGHKVLDFVVWPGGRGVGRFRLYFSNRCLTASIGWYRIILGPATLITWRIRSLISFL